MLKCNITVMQEEKS